MTSEVQNEYRVATYPGIDGVLEFSLDVSMDRSALAGFTSRLLEERGLTYHVSRDDLVAFAKGVLDDAVRMAIDAANGPAGKAAREVGPHVAENLFRDVSVHADD